MATPTFHSLGRRLGTVLLLLVLWHGDIPPAQAATPAALSRGQPASAPVAPSPGRAMANIGAATPGLASFLSPVWNYISTRRGIIQVATIGMFLGLFIMMRK